MTDWNDVVTTKHGAGPCPVCGRDCLNKPMYHRDRPDRYGAAMCGPCFKAAPAPPHPVDEMRAVRQAFVDGEGVGDPEKVDEMIRRCIELDEMMRGD